MITLIDRADGTPLWELSSEDFKVLQDQLVLESDQDYDYYLNDATLDMLAGAGMSPDAVSAISARMRHRGLDVGWEHSPLAAAHTYSGVAFDRDGNPQGGLRVDLVEGTRMVSWTYVRQDGAFSLSSTEDAGGLYLRFSGRGDLILRQDAISDPGDQGTFEIQTLHGRVLTDADEPLAGVNVALISWKPADGGDSHSWTDLGGQRSWGDTDEQGHFSIPVSVPEDLGVLEIELELTTVDGQTLETVTRTISPGEGFDLGYIRAPRPQPLPEPGTAENAIVE